MRIRLAYLASLCLGAYLVTACKLIDGHMVCAGVGYFALRITVVDQLDRPQALGAVVHIFNGTHTEVDTAGDTLTVYAAEEGRGFTYDIVVTKPYYQDAWARGIKVPAGGFCPPPIQVDVPMRILLGPGAPPVRSVHLLPTWAALDRPPYQSSVTFKPIVDADPGAWTAVTWTVTGDTASAAFDKTTGTFTYRCLPTSGYMTVKATSVVDTTLFGTAKVQVQGHPAATNDPPCS